MSEFCSFEHSSNINQFYLSSSLSLMLSVLCQTCAATAPLSNPHHKAVVLPPPLWWFTFVVNGNIRRRAREGRRVICGGIALSFSLFFFPSFSTPITSKLCHLHHRRQWTLHHTWRPQHHLQDCSAASPDYGLSHNDMLTLLKKVQFWWRQNT